MSNRFAGTGKYFSMLFYTVYILVNTDSFSSVNILNWVRVRDSQSARDAFLLGRIIQPWKYRFILCEQYC